MTIEEIVNTEKIDFLLDQSIYFNTTDKKILQLKDYLETFRNYIKTPYSSYKMFKLFPLEVGIFYNTLDLFKNDYKYNYSNFIIMKQIAKNIIEKSNEILELIENNAL
jgi:hypothetical protein